MNQNSFKSVNPNDIDELTNSILSKIKDNIREVIREHFSKHLYSANTISEAGILEPIDYSENLFETIFYQVLNCTIPQILSEQYNSSEDPKNSVYHLINNSLQNYIKANRTKLLFKSQEFEEIPTPLLMLSSINTQINKEEVWQKNEYEIAYSQHRDKNNPQNYIEHYVSTPGDITLLPWNEAQQIIEKFGFNSAKLHLIFSAYAMKQEKPWESLFILNASDLIKEMGWDKRTDVLKHQKLLEIAKTAFALDCLLVKAVWIEGRNNKGGINASTPVGRMWNITIVPSGQMNLSGTIEEPDEINIIIQPGTWTRHFLNRTGSESREALYQFGYLAQQVLKIDPYHEELALRLAIYLTLDIRVCIDREYKVEELLEIALPKTEIDKARGDRIKAFSLKQRWDNALNLLEQLGWHITYDPENYPEWLRPDHKEKKPKGYLEKLLVANLTIKLPDPIPGLIASKFKTKAKRIPSKAKEQPPQEISLTGIQIREARIAKKWSQTKLADILGVSQKLISLIELGQRTITPQLANQIQTLLDITP